MSMILSQPAMDACAHAKSMIDAVTGHQPSPLDGETAETQPTPKQKPGDKSTKTNRVENEQSPAHQVAGEGAVSP